MKLSQRLENILIDMDKVENLEGGKPRHLRRLVHTYCGILRSMYIQGFKEDYRLYDDRLHEHLGYDPRLHDYFERK